MANAQCPNCGGFHTYNRRTSRVTNDATALGGAVVFCFLALSFAAVVPLIGLPMLLVCFVWGSVHFVRLFVGVPAGREPLGCGICNFNWDEADRPETRLNRDRRRLGQNLYDEEEAAAQNAAQRRRRHTF